jgi:short-subunit dehydrogenase
MDLRGKNAILTGASRGIGRVIAQAMANEGMNLVLAARSADLLATLEEELTRSGTSVAIVPVDLGGSAGCHELVEKAIGRFGPIDVLVNCAGVDPMGSFSRISEDDLRCTVDVNLFAPLLLTRLLLPGMLERRRGHIVTISSVSGKKGIPYEAAYSATKAAQIEWNNALRVELAGSGVDTSVVCPGYVSEVGLFAEHGVPAPRLAGSVRPEAVARATVRALRKNRQEVIVCPTPTRPLLALNALSPSFGNRIIAAMGVTKMQRMLAAKRDSEAR